MSYKFDAKEHVHLLNGEPLYGTSTVIKEVMPPFLAKWGAQCAVDHIKAVGQLIENPIDQGPDEAPIDGSYYQVYAGEVEKAILAWSKVRKEAAVKGTDMHALLEEYVGQCIKENNGKPLAHSVNETKQVSGFVDWSLEAVDKFIGSEVYTYSKELHVGGIVDCFAKMRDGSYAVIDFKSSKEAYFNQFAQAAGYALQLQETGYGDENGDNWTTLEHPITKLIVVPFGAKEFKIDTIENVQGYQDVFRSLVNVYSFLRSFNAK